jgi:Tol biopolymer transport system component
MAMERTETDALSEPPSGRRARRTAVRAVVAVVAVVAVGGAALTVAHLDSRGTSTGPALQRFRNGAIVLLVSKRGLTGIDGDLYSVDPGGTVMRRVPGSRDAVGAAFSPDGTRLLLAQSPDESGSNIVVMNADGTDRHVIAAAGSTNPARAALWQFPSWLPDGAGVRVYRNDRGGPAQGLWTANADGSNLKLKIPRWVPFLATWSPDGTRIAWEGDRGTGAGGADLFVSDATGAHRQRLTSDPGQVGTMSWSPNGKRIVFANGGAIDVIDADGRGRRTIFRCDGACLGAAFPVWSPDGTQIVFSSSYPGSPGRPLTQRAEVMDADGSHVRPLLDGSLSGIPVAWQPLPD